ncbi:hypothetical protein BY457_12627 [Marinilabilia salmonicolor]|nr:hypothetical protein BY457_12627 [Marinilabilia salmonicolor]
MFAFSTIISVHRFTESFREFFHFKENSSLKMLIFGFAILRN